MCNNRNSTEIHYRNQSNRFAKVDECIADEIVQLNKEVKTLSSCCGHGKYKKTIVVLGSKNIIEIYSCAIIPRTKRFYKRDKQGYYYIPEAIG